MEKTYTLTGAQDIAGKARREARAIVVTPVGLQGRGGIDRLNLYLNEYLSQRGTAADIEFIGSRGEWLVICFGSDPGVRCWRPASCRRTSRDSGSNPSMRSRPVPT